jgi:hypothetical protein
MVALTGMPISAFGAQGAVAMGVARGDGAGGLAALCAKTETDKKAGRTAIRPIRGSRMKDGQATCIIPLRMLGAPGLDFETWESTN